MVRQYWALINMAVCAIVGFVILVPLVPTVLSSMVGDILPGFAFPSLNPFVATAISGVIAIVIAAVFYKITLGSAKDFLRKAEV
jgi:uncharacterized membrane protein